MDFEILLLKRSPDISFPNQFVFPGGKIEDSDFPSKWANYVPEMCGWIPDFAKRMSAMRELFEETNILIGAATSYSYDPNSIEGKVPFNELYSTDYADGNFL